MPNDTARAPSQRPPSFTRFQYRGPTTSITLRDRDGVSHTLVLHRNTSVALPASHPYASSLIARGLLVALPNDAPNERTADAEADTATTPEMFTTTTGRIRTPRPPRKEIE